MLERLALLLATAILLSACGDNTPRESLATPVATQSAAKEYFNDTVPPLSTAWEDASYKVQLIQQFSKYSPRFDVYCGYAVANAADTISSWKIAGGDPDKVKDAQDKLKTIRESFEDSVLSYFLPIPSPEDLELTQQISGMMALFPSLFLLDMIDKKVNFEIHPELMPKRDISHLKAHIREIINQPDSTESACYWLGWLARETEKANQPLDDYWKACNTEGIARETLGRLVDLVSSP